MQIILFEALYLHVDSLGGWGIAEMRVFLGVLFLVDAFQMVLFAHNFDVFSEKIVHRDLDLLLLRPVKLTAIDDITKTPMRLSVKCYFCSIMVAMESLIAT